MKNKKGLLLDAAIGFVLTLFVMLSYRQEWPMLAAVEFKAYDLRAKLRETLKSPDEIALVAVDEESISQIGRWPWPRTKIADGIAKIAAAHPRVIGLSVLFSEPEQSLGLVEVKRLEDRYKELIAAKKITQRGADFDLEFASSTVALDSDSRLLASLQSAGDVVMPLFFAPNETHGKPVDPIPEVSSAAIKLAGRAPEGAVVTMEKMLWPLAPFSGAAAGLGHSNFFPESDGVFRRDAPLIQYAGALYPSFALRLVMAYDGVKPADVKFTPGVEVAAGRFRVPIDDEGLMPVTFIGPPNFAGKTIQQVSFRSVLDGSVSPDFLKDKIVLIGPTALGVGTEYVTPVSGNFPAVEILAHVTENILHQRFLVRPPWAPRAELALLAVIGLFVMLILPRLRAFWGLIVSLLFALLIAGAGTYFFIEGQWLKIGYALVLLIGGYIVVISKSFLITEKGKELVEASAIETNKMLGLSFQGQGMLDLAFEKFRLCPLDDNMKDTLYNLALDFERKRQFSKAAAVLDHIATKDPKYKDIADKTKMLKAASEGAVFGGVGGAKKEGTVMITGGTTKPTLGRYEIEKELGRGAMGVVYLGKDPKINRMVAIKTMMLEDGSNEAEAKAVKERFFREAESAGTLNHPNIVRIFDAGEENEVAYIAMELLDGHDLVKYCSKDSMLPLGKAVEYVAVVADALDYAHAQGIVHRDIKPANIMELKDGTIRVADFGIARITASSKTATGTVMGTPSYMSPEQVAGKKVDGRSDLFSLAVALFELATGEKPFKGGEGIGTLLFQIANDPHPDPLAIRADLPPALKAVIDKALSKNPDQRYQRGSEFAAALRAAMKGGASAPAAPPPPSERTAPTAEITAPVTAEAAPVRAADKTAPAVKPAATVEIAGLDEFLNAAAPASAPAPAPAPTPAAAPAPASEPKPAPVSKPIDPQKTISIGPELTIPGLNDFPLPTRPAPTPVPDVPAPSPAPAPAAPAPAAAPEADATMRIEPPTRSGVGPAITLPPAPKPGGDSDGGMRIEPTQNPDATIRLKPNTQEPL